MWYPGYSEMWHLQFSFYKADLSLLLNSCKYNLCNNDPFPNLFIVTVYEVGFKKKNVLRNTSCQIDGYSIYINQILRNRTLRRGSTYKHRIYKPFMVHDDVIKWKHFPRNWPFVRGIHRSPVNSQHKGQWRTAVMFSLICVWINSWVNNDEPGDLRRYRAHYDVIVMWSALCLLMQREAPEHGRV